MLISSEQLHLCIPHASDRRIQKYLLPINATLERYLINSPARIAAFLAQITHESGSLKYVEELADGSAYEYRNDLGNLHDIAIEVAHAKGTTTGRFYKGRGLIQITGFYNYSDCGKGLDLDLVHCPELLTIPYNAAMSAGWYWSTHNCNALADVGAFDKITKTINGGFNGKKARDGYYANNKQVLGVDLRRR